MSQPPKRDYSLHDLDRLARQATTSCGPMGSDWLDRYQTAWCAIAEVIYTAEAPDPSTLIWAGRNAIYDDVRAYRRHHGFFHGDNEFGPYTSPAFWKYWWPVSFSVGSHEDRVVERRALLQILSALTPVHREALIALAVWEDTAKAAEALGISYTALNQRVFRARAHFRELWHEGERPTEMFTQARTAGQKKRQERERKRQRDARTDP